MLKASFVKSFAKEFSVLVFAELLSDPDIFLNPSYNLDTRARFFFTKSNNSSTITSTFTPSLSVNKRTAVPVSSSSSDNNKCSLVTTKLEVSSAYL